MTRRLLGAAALCLACACATNAWAQGFDTSAGNLLALLRESPGNNRPEEKLDPIGLVRAQLADGREVDIDASWFQYLGDMHVRLVFDGEASMQTASPGDLERLHLSPQDAVTQAVDNMRRRYGAPRVQPYGGGLMQVVAAEPDLVSSYFLDRALWQDQLHRYPQGVVASVPLRGGLLFAPADDEKALTNLRFSAAALFTASDRTRVSSALYLFKDGRWSVFQAPRL
ncbi:MAG: hypothetical protein HY854_00250 [Burkholderiales bacterium]|nr:hypothetical protein [Burkholderiales bacterium]